MLIDGQKSERTNATIGGWVSRVSKVSRERLKWTSRVIITLVAAGIVANCSASEITAPGPSTAFAPQQLKPLAQATSDFLVFKAERDLTEPPVNPCNPLEALVVEGKSTLTIKVTRTPSGNFHLYMSDDSKGTATGTTGSLWVIDSRDFQETEVAGATETTVVLKRVYVSKGTQPDFLHHTIWHVMTTVDGLPTATPQQTKTECKG